MLGKLRRDYTPIPVVEQPRARLTTDLEQAVAAPSPARALQQQLEQRAGAAPEHQFSPRSKLAIIVASASTLWIALLAAGAGVVHAIA